MLIYSDDWTDSYATYEDAEAAIQDEKQALFDEIAEEEGWETVDDIPNEQIEMIYEHMADSNTRYFEDSVEPYLDKIFNKDIIWTNDYHSYYPDFTPSRKEGYKLTTNAQEAWGLCPNSANSSIEIHDEDGVLKLVLHDHDGTNTVWGRLLTDDGEDLYNDWKDNPYNDIDYYGSDEDWMRAHCFDEKDLTYFSMLNNTNEYDIYDLLFKNDEYSENVNLAKQMGLT